MPHKLLLDYAPNTPIVLSRNFSIDYTKFSQQPKDSNSMLSQEYIKLALLAGIYILLFIYEQYSPYFKHRQQHAKHWLRNLTLASINAGISTLFLVFAISYVCQWTLDNNFGLLNQLNIHTIYSYVLAILLIDCWQYIWHRANHVAPLLWMFHQVHHSDKDMDASTGLRFHPIEIVYSSLIRLAIIPLAGIQLEQLILYEIILLPIILFHHSNIKINESLDRFLRIIIVTPHMHRLHHSDIQSETDSNYSSIFSIWDRLFNTFTMRPIENEFNLGLGVKFKSKEWNSFKGMIMIPFSKN